MLHPNDRFRGVRSTGLGARFSLDEWLCLSWQMLEYSVKGGILRIAMI